MKLVNLAAGLAFGLCILAVPGYAESADDHSIRPFKAQVPQAEIDELRRRINATRWPDRETVDDQSQGIQLAKLKPLVEYWGTGYDWRKAEAKLNALPQFMTTIDGVDVHFIHVRSRHENALPLIMTHGWPGSVFELLETVGPLTDPTAHGGSAEDAFHLVLPSMPGYAFSGKPTDIGWGPDRIARAWAQLMVRLGYTRYIAQGGDWGSPVSSAMARQAPEGLLGIHINLPAIVPPEIAAVLAVSGPAPAGLTEKERATFEQLSAAAKMGNRSYAAMMGTRPQTIGYAITDSPAGLAAWMLGHPGFSNWTYDSSDPEKSPDEVLDDVTLYWLTNTATSAGRLYWEYGGGRSPAFSALEMTTEISLPVAITVFPRESYRAPETWARRAYPNLIYFNEVDKGGHFAAWEQPQLFSEELRAAFRSLREAQ
jgi:pimeloyl-ACP methyl ester carboxylesterase